MKAFAIATVGAVLLACSAGSARGSHATCLQINKVSLGGSHQRLACYRGAYASFTALSRDHQHLYYVEHGFEYPSPYVRVARVDGSSNSRVFTAPGAINAFRLSPDSRRIAFSTFVTAGYGGSDGLWVVNSDGTGLRRLDTRFASGLAWAPDSRRLAVQRYRGSGQPAELSIVDAETGIERGLADGGNPQWSPDGRFIAFQARRDIRIADVEGGSSRLLVRGSSPQWLADGRQLSFLASRPGQRSLWVISRAGNLVRRLVRRAGRPGGPWTASWSPRGTKLAYVNPSTSPPQGIVMVALQDTKPRQLARPQRNRAVHSLSWSRDGRSLLYISQIIPEG